MIESVDPPRKFRNTKKMVELSRANWQIAESSNLINFYVKCGEGGRLVQGGSGREFINMSSYSYLGLNCHPAVIQGAIDALEESKILGLGITPTRIQLGIMDEVQDNLSALFGAKCLLTLSCTVATTGILPLISSGHLSDGKPRVTVFDKRCHFCMDMVKPICADEAPVMVCPHNDMNFLEDVCKRSERVAFIADGAYSMGGVADLDALSMLQDKYGLFLWLDDSHAISVVGERGEGYVKSRIDELNPLTVICASLEKGFGCSGGVLMFHAGQDTSFINTFAGPMCWSQNLSVGNLGSIRACAAIHDGPELTDLQGRLQENIRLFDSEIPTPLRGSTLPVRALVVGDTALAIRLSMELFAEGFYSAPVYFPITSRGREGLRVMIRADIPHGELTRFCRLLNSNVVPHMVK